MKQTRIDPDQKIAKNKRKRIVKSKEQRKIDLKKEAKENFQFENEQFDENENDNKIEDDDDDSEAEIEKKETAAQKRLRLAKQYLQKVKEEVADDEDDDPDKDLIADRLKYDALEVAGKNFHKVAERYANLENVKIRTFKAKKNCHQQSITSISVAKLSERFLNKKSQDNSALNNHPVYIYSTSKDGSIVKWCFYTGKKLKYIPGLIKPTKRIKKKFNEKMITSNVGHNDHILCSATSMDGRFLVTGGKDKVIQIWSVLDDKNLGQFKQHRDAISCLVFRMGTNQLFSGSFDRSVKVWNVEELSYIETLFGHQDGITNIAALSKERCLTSGARDRTVRLWKIVEESQLIFRCAQTGEDDDLLLIEEGGDIKKKKKIIGASGGSVDTVCMIDEETFISGTDSGAISLWSVNKKKPVYTRLRCHGNGEIKEGKNLLGNNSYCNWITSLASLPYTDLFASGSCDGFVRLWKIHESKKSFSILSHFPCLGFINTLSFFYGPRIEVCENEKVNKEENFELNCLYLAIGVGQEHRLGRWWSCKEAKNCVKVVTLN
ncbi:pre-rRNA processing protein [Clydaea vesicula]|uniref:Pre-rRNA processing protein n=1 Tax=Clydaea vesicula TaxID=447962 RepID=A0AAD5U2P4_9FUNG|nr:pre-rRNA processing protein [Clydaea vesicula]